MTTSRIALTALTTAAVLGVAACSSGPDPSNPDDTVTMSSSESSTSESNTSASESSETGSGSTSTSDDGGLSEVLAAIEQAVDKTGGTAYDVDEKDDDGSWEVDLANGPRSAEVEISASGDVTEHAEDDLEAEVREGLDRAEISISAAVETAMEEVDGIFHDAQLKEIDGDHYWQVSIDTAATEEEDDDHQVLVDVTDGEVSVSK